jgi:hypothetical protein
MAARESLMIKNSTLSRTMLWVLLWVLLCPPRVTASGFKDMALHRFDRNSDRRASKGGQ